MPPHARPNSRPRGEASEVGRSVEAVEWAEAVKGIVGSVISAAGGERTRRTRPLALLSAAADVFVCQKHPLPLTMRTLSLVPKGPKTYPRSDLTFPEICQIQKSSDFRIFRPNFSPKC